MGVFVQKIGQSSDRTPGSFNQHTEMENSVLSPLMHALRLAFSLAFELA